MDITIIIGLLGGLALFLYGMQMMSNGLENAAGDKMGDILEKLTSNRFIGVAVGALITAVIQSSSATTVMVVGFVNTGMMTLQQAVWVIMGANIGTTITGQLMTLDMDMIAPLLAFGGVAMIVFLKKPKIQHIGKVLAGLGILFIGMDMMGEAMKPLEDSEVFVNIMTTFSNPLVGIVAGMIFTALIQSSSATVGILQTLSRAGLLSFNSAVFVLFGTNIGTCITALLAAIGANRSAKRTTIIHLLFNVIGTVIFTTVCLLTPLADWVGSWTPGVPDAQLANMHTFFNVVTTVCLIPFGALLAKAAYAILPDSPEDSKKVSILGNLNKEFRANKTHLGADMVHVDLLRQEIGRMIDLAGKNANMCFNAVLNADDSQLAEVEENEKLIDKLNRDVSEYITRILSASKNDDVIATIEQYFVITSNAERIGDHAINLSEYVGEMKSKKITLSEQAHEELVKMQLITQKAIDKVLHKDDDIAVWLSDIAAMEQQIDDMARDYKELHLDRMREGKCSTEACILYSELLTDFERIGDHILNIGQAIAKMTR